MEEITLDEYLWRVVAAEMPASFHPEALKAQTVAARTYCLYQRSGAQSKHPGAWPGGARGQRPWDVP